MKRIAATSFAGALIALLSFLGTPNAEQAVPLKAKPAKVTLQSLAAQVNTLQSTLTSLQSTITSLQGTLTSDNSNLGSVIASLQTTLTSLQSTVTTVQGQVSSLQSSVTSLQTTLTSLQSTVTTVQGQVSSLQSSVTSVQNQLSSQGAQSAFNLGKFMSADANGDIGIGTTTPEQFLSLEGSKLHSLGLDSNPNGAGNALTINGGASESGSTDLAGGDLVLASGVGTGLGASGNTRLQTGGANDSTGTTADTLVDREIMVGKAKQLTLASPGFTSLMSIQLTGTHTAGGRIFYNVRATDGGSQIATETGVIQYTATANSITCTVQTTDKLHLGTVNSGCTPGFFNPGSQPGISIFDNVSFANPAAIAVHEVYFKVENESGSPLRLEP